MAQQDLSQRPQSSGQPRNATLCVAGYTAGDAERRVPGGTLWEWQEEWGMEDRSEDYVAEES